MTMKRRILALILSALMLFTPAFLTGCDEAVNGKDGKDGTVWYRGTANIETVTDGKTGDFYVDTDNYKVYQKNSDGTWTLIMENFGKPGDATEPKNSFVYVRYAKDDSGTDISTDPTGRSYISVLTTEKENPAPSDFTVWVKFVGENGETGPTGASGKSSYTYVAFASDSFGTGFSFTHTEGLDYIGILVTDTEMTALGKPNFAGKWIRFVGNDGLTPYIGYDGYWWTGTERGTQKFVEVLNEYTAENTVGLAGNKYFDSYAIDMGQKSVVLMSNYFPSIKKTAYSTATISKVQVYAETEGTLTVSTVKTKGLANRTSGGSFTLNTVKQFTLTKGLNELDLGGITVPEGETLVLGKTGDTAKLIAYKGIENDDEQGYFTILGETGLYKEIEGVKDRLVIKVEVAGSYEAISGLRETIETIGSLGSGWKSVKLPGPYTHGNITAYEGKTISHIEVRAFSHTATSADNVFMTVRVVKQSNAALVSTHEFYADPEDITGSTLGKVIRLTCEDKITVGEDETLVFGSGDDTLLWSYITNLPSSPVTGGFRAGTSVGSSIGTVKTDGLVNMLAVNVCLVTSTHAQRINQLEFEEKLEMELIPGLKEILSGKNVSIVGDSISTYEGVSNNANINSSLSGNKVYYKGTNGVAQNDTWWMQAINNYDMQLNVNNSYSGSWVTDQRVGTVAACNTRAENLHTNAGVKPDIIAVFMGTNDLGGGSPGPRPCNQTFDSAFFSRVESGSYTASVSKDGATIPTYFDEGYALMLYKMKTNYPDADVFCCTIPRASGGRDGELLDKYNNAIKEIAKHYGYSVVDLYSTALSTESATYTLDGLHPNALGMDIITKELEKAMARKYLVQ